MPVMPGHSASEERTMKISRLKNLRAACSRPPILSRATALIGGDVWVSVDVRSRMLSGYQPRRVVREGERERPSEVDSKTDQRIVDGGGSKRRPSSATHSSPAHRHSQGFDKDPCHVRALSWLRWAYYSPPASLRLHCVYAPADIIACYCPYGEGTFEFQWT
jgi:hypothetical protein